MYVCMFLSCSLIQTRVLDHLLRQTADLASANASEEDKVKAMMNQSSKDYDPSRYSAHEIDVTSFFFTFSVHCMNNGACMWILFMEQGRGFEVYWVKKILSLWWLNILINAHQGMWASLPRGVVLLAWRGTLPLPPIAATAAARRATGYSSVPLMG